MRAINGLDYMHRLNSMEKGEGGKREERKGRGREERGEEGEGGKREERKREGRREKRGRRGRGGKREGGRGKEGR